MNKAKERAEPPTPEPVEIDGVTYAALLWGKERGLGQNGGLIVATDSISGEELWVLKVYDVSYERDIEPDKQDVFIETMRAEAGALLIENEKGRVFRVSLADRSVTEVLH